MAGCSNNFTPDKALDCVEGKYKVPGDMNKQAELRGQYYDSINIVNNGDTCSVMVELEEPIIVLGSSMKVIEGLSCDLACVSELRENKCLLQQRRACMSDGKEVEYSLCREFAAYSVAEQEAIKAEAGINNIGYETVVECNPALDWTSTSDEDIDGVAYEQCCEQIT